MGEKLSSVSGSELMRVLILSRSASDEGNGAGTHLMRIGVHLDPVLSDLRGRVAVREKE